MRNYLPRAMSVAGLVVLLSLGIAACGGGEEFAAPTEQVLAPVPVPLPAPEPAPEPGVVIPIVGGEPVNGVVKVKVKKGETAVFTVSSDALVDVHVHGLDVTMAVGPGQDARFEIETSFEGIFEIELHGPSGHVEIGSLVIEP